MNTLAGKIRVDFRSTEPIYLQIARQVEQLVAQGDLKRGEQLPTVREMATELRINFNTVTRAYKVLDDARIISTQRGRGTYIWDEPNAQVKQQLRQEGLKAMLRRCIAEARRQGFLEDEITQAFDEQMHAWKNTETACNPGLLAETKETE